MTTVEAYIRDLESGSHLMLPESIREEVLLMLDTHYSDHPKYILIKDGGWVWLIEIE